MSQRNYTDKLTVYHGTTSLFDTIDVETGLCYEMYDAIYEMFLEEMKSSEL